MKPKSDFSPFELPIETSEGTFLAHYSSRGLAGLDFPATSRVRPIDAPAVPPQVRTWHHTTIRALKSALAGKAPETLPPLDFSRGTEFQRSVWSALRNIAAGETLSYAEVAGKIGRPKAVRAVGGACGANPIPVLVPCHRVLAANHQLGGFSADLDWKRTLLQREGVAFRAVKQ